MADETSRPIMPKRPGTVHATPAPEPAVVKPLSKKTGKRKLQELEEESFVVTLRDRACALLAIEQGVDHAAKTLRITPEEVNYILDSPPVRWLLKELQHEDIVNLSKMRVKNLTKKGISRVAIEERLFELMHMDPEKTKGNIDGQVKAANTLIEKLGYGQQGDPLAGKSPAELEEIVRQGNELMAKRTSVN